MSNREPLSESAVQDALGDLPGWRHNANRLEKEFEFSSFREAISFIVRMSFEAEERDHHPEMSNVYNRVSIALSTHDAGHVVTQMDLDLARAIEEFSWVIPPSS